MGLIGRLVRRLRALPPPKVTREQAIEIALSVSTAEGWPRGGSPRAEVHDTDWLVTMIPRPGKCYCVVIDHQSGRVTHSGKYGLTPMLYRGTTDEIRVGDRVSLRFRFRRRLGTVCYIPGVSPRHPELEDRVWAISLDDKRLLVMGYDPVRYRYRPRKDLMLLGRSTVGELKPDEVVK